ncbi:hypothetical protein A6R68_22108, partial [Neotoma lepida]
VRLVDIKGTPMPNEQVFIKARELGYTNVTTTDQHGLAEFPIHTTNIKGSSLNIKVYHKEENSCVLYPCTAEEHAEVHHVAHSVYSNSWSYIHLETEAGVLSCSQNHTVRAHFILQGPSSSVPRKHVFYYLVDLTFTPAQSLPASQAHLRVTASPQSLCGLRAVDQSVLLLKPEVELSPSWIYNLPDMQPSNFIPSSYQILEDQPPYWWDRDSDGLPPLHPNERDVYSYVE